MRTLVSSDKLRTLFEAHRDGNESAFARAADSIISEELAANHHSAATDLKRALGGDKPLNGTTRAPVMRSIPKDRRLGDDLLLMKESTVSPERVILESSTQARIDRVLEEHRQRKQLNSYGYRPKSKLLFWGPPGTGKTMTALMLGHELGLPVGVVRLSAVISSFLGDTASHLQRIFSQAGSSPMVLLLDEIDAVGKHRDDPNDVGELKRVVNSLLQAMDTFAAGESLVVAASNHQYLLDPALWRRFDDVVHFALPGTQERLKYARLMLSGVRISGALTEFSRRSSGLSFSDLERVIEEAIKSMILTGNDTVSPKDLLVAMSQWRQARSGASTRPQNKRR